MSKKEVLKELDKDQRIKKHNMKKKGEDKDKETSKIPKVKQVKRVARKNWLRDYELGDLDEDEYLM